jgi:L-aspartate oxidase
MRHVTGIDLHKRFPGISAFLAKYGLDLHRDLIPVRPAAHYLMGGVKTDMDGRTTVKGLYAAGEAACTGVHGANRLASNSLLEGLVFGARAAKAMIADALPLREAPDGAVKHRPVTTEEQAGLEDSIAGLQRSMWRNAALLRDRAALGQALADAEACATNAAQFAGLGAQSRRLFEARAMSRVAQAIVRSALARTESRGAHFRTDFPQHDDASFRKHSVFGREPEVIFEAW